MQLQIILISLFSIGLAILVFMFLKTFKAEKVLTKQEVQQMQNKFNL
jgi:flagellar basal body-associated protein FliL